MNESSVRVLVRDEALRSHVIACLELVGERVEVATIGPWPSSGIVVTDGCADLSGCDLPVIMVTQSGIDPPVLDEGTLSRVAAHLPAPLALNALLVALGVATRLTEQRGFDWSEPDKRNARFERLAGGSERMQRLRELMGKVAGKDVSVLITGEIGTGKDVVARSLHEASHRARRPFVPVNCGAIPAEALESDLFGHEKGAFSGAISSRPGRFELADTGTLLLDEVSELPLPIQLKLLRALQDGCFERVGGNAGIRCNVRVMAATHRDLEALVETGAFRADLYYHLNAFPLQVPALRERLDDVPDLVAALSLEVERRHECAVRFDAAALDALATYRWPGNVRELANVIERMAIVRPGSVIGTADLPRKIARQAAGPASSSAHVPGVERAGAGLIDPDHPPLLPVNGIDLKDYMNRLERSLIRQALDDTDSVVARAADRLHIRRTTLVEKMRKHGLQRGDALEL